MSLALANLEAAGTSSAGASTHDTGALLPTSDRGFVVFCFATRGGSADPDSATLSGCGLTWLPGPDYLMSTTGTVRRRVQCFYAQSFTESPNPGALTFAYSNTPSSLSWVVVEITGGDPSVIKAANVGTGTPNTNYSSGSLKEDITLAALDAGNTVLSFAATNVNSTTLRGELAADSGGDTDHATIGAYNSGTGVARSVVAFAGGDTTPGSLTNNNSAFGQVSLEIVVAAVDPDPEPEPEPEPEPGETYATIAEAVVAAPAASVGVPTGYGDWRIGVEMLMPSDAHSLWGLARWGDDEWSALGWVDITEHVRGMEWTRGADEFDGRPFVGVGTVTLDNSDFIFSPIDPANSFNGIVNADESGAISNYYFGPGAVMRIVCHSPSGYGHDDGENVHAAGNATGVDAWVPMMTGVVESWPEVRMASDAESFIDVTLVETLSLLARVDENALALLVGNNDTAIQRIQRLADEAEWRFGYHDICFAEHRDTPLQSTDMALNRLGEVYLTADSVGAKVRSGRDGRILFYGTAGENDLTERGPFQYPLMSATAELSKTAEVVDIDPERLTIDNDNSAIINVAQIGRAGGTVQTAVDAFSIGRFKARFVTKRTDLINKSDAVCLDIAESIIEHRANLVTRLRGVRLHNLADASAAGVLITMDVGSQVGVVINSVGPGYLYYPWANIDLMVHRVTPTTPDGIAVWTADYTFGRQDAPHLIEP